MLLFLVKNDEFRRLKRTEIVIFSCTLDIQMKILYEMEFSA